MSTADNEELAFAMVLARIAVQAENKARATYHKADMAHEAAKKISKARKHELKVLVAQLLERPLS